MVVGLMKRGKGRRWGGVAATKAAVEHDKCRVKMKLSRVKAAAVNEID